MPGREVDDAFEAVVEFEGGAVGTIEASRFAAGRKNAFALGDQRLEGLARLRPRAAQRAAGLRGREGLPDAARLRARPSVPGAGGGRRATCSAGSTPSSHEVHHLLDAIATDGDGRAARRDVRGRLPRGRGLRRDRAVGRVRAARDDLVPLSTAARFESQLLGRERAPRSRRGRASGCSPCRPRTCAALGSRSARARAGLAAADVDRASTSAALVDRLAEPRHAAPRPPRGLLAGCTR